MKPTTKERRQMHHLVFAFPVLMLLAFQCSDDAVAIQEDPVFKAEALDSLCTYEVPSADQTARQNEDRVIISVKDLTGQVTFISSEDSYAVTTSVDGTYDCQVVLFTSDDLKEELNQTVTFSGDVVPYRGSYTPAVGGQKVFAISSANILK